MAAASNTSKANRSARAAAHPNTGSASPPERSSASSPAESPPYSAGLRQAALYLCFALSGLSGLIYQIAWMRAFSVVFGTAEQAVAAVLAAYMAGLALGAHGIRRLLPRIRRPVQVYALLEALTAGAVLLLLPWCFELARLGLIAWFGHQPDLPSDTQAAVAAYNVAGAFITLMIPTTLMGATLPLLAQESVHSDGQVGTRVGILYGCNTGGAVGGALLATLWLLPDLGIRATQYVAAAVNLIVCVLALALVRTAEAGVRVPDGAMRSRPARRAWILPLMALSGAVAFLQEVLWTRLLQHIVGGSVMAFGIMVASFLLGIALGGLLGSRLARNSAVSARWWSLAQSAVALFSLGAWYVLETWGSAQGSFWSRALFALLLLLPLTTALGATFPLAVRILATHADEAGDASARIYSWNVIGGIAGAIGGGFLVIPWLRYEGSLTLAVLINLLLAASCPGLLHRPSWRNWTVPAAILGLLIAVWPQAPVALLHRSPIRTANGPLLYYAVGRSADVVAVSGPRLLGLFSNGLPEAGIMRRGAEPAVTADGWMAALPVLSRPSVRQVLVVGFGGGNVINAMPPSVSAIDVIEIEPEILSANRVMAPLRDLDPLNDGRVSLCINDARSALALSVKRYDTIISQPSHPWTAAASHLYTREFLQSARTHLNPGGIFVEWMDSDFVDEPLLRSILATLSDVFPQVRLYRPSPTEMVLLASEVPIDPERDPRRLQQQLDGASRFYAHLGFLAPEDLVGGLALDTRGVRALARGYPLITDDDNRLATAGVIERHAGMSARALSHLLAPFDPLVQPDSSVHRELNHELSFDYIWRMQTGSGEPGTAQRMQRLGVILGDSEQGAYIRYEEALHRQRPEEATAILDTALMRWPASPLLRYAAVEPYLPALASGAADPAAAGAMVALPAQPALIVSALRLAGQQRWADVAQMDNALAAVPVTAAWSSEAVQLRAAWRAQVANPDLRPRMADEALAILDAAVPPAPSATWYALRADSQSGGDRPAAELESIAGFVEAGMAELPQSDDAHRNLLLEDAVRFNQRLQSLAGDADLPPGRIQQVGTRLITLMGRLRS